MHCNAPDIFGVSETHLSPHESASLIQDLTPPDYNFFHIPRPDRPGGGVGCFIKSSFTGKIRSKFLIFEVLVLQVKSSNLCFYFTSTYRPPSNIHMDTVSLYSGKLKHILNVCNLIQHVKQQTHIHGHIIDLFITTPEIQVSNVCIGQCLNDYFSISSLINF
jgi:hypothetical protein